ncbi:GABA-A receptor epsilon-like subunit [Tieghemostelium lacteum]|uniref:GABA-A receptor epsilon-like subunit n=1 Tax=Tieghemostelium lacteum TaxID=361077 RepID=A0A151Z6U3_TIELA|nr:GABA-A receptor epsilon-like subunit [Tieghemostelium lacteum]|eukprot:KYQ89504.1 GABA-A receptor epsilon-like subunit [Tieghemostelium lacteum]
MNFPRLIFVKIFKYFQYNEPDGRWYKVYKLISLLNRECRYFIAPLFSYKITIDDFSTVKNFLKFNHQYHKAELTLDTKHLSIFVVEGILNQFRKIYLSHKYNIIPLVKKLIIGKYLFSWLDYFGPKSSSQIESLEIRYKEDRGEGFEKYLFKNNPFPISPDHLQTLNIVSNRDLDVDLISQIFQGYHHLEKLIFSYRGKYPIGPELNKFEKLSVLSHLSHLELDRVIISPNEFIEYLSTTTSNIETLILNSIQLKDIIDNNNNDINNSNNNNNSSIGLDFIIEQISHSKTIKTLKVLNQYGVKFPSIDINNIIDLINRNSTLETIIYDTNDNDNYNPSTSITSTISNDTINNQTLKHLKINQSPIDIHTLWISNSNLRTIRILNEQQPISLFENPQTFHHQSIRKLHFQFTTTLQSLIEIIQINLPTLTTIKISTQYNRKQYDIDFETIFTAISNNNNIDSISIKCSIKIEQFLRLIERNIKHLRKIHVNLEFTAKDIEDIGSKLNQNTNIQEFSLESWSEYRLIVDLVILLLECKHITSIKCHCYESHTKYADEDVLAQDLKLNLDHILNFQIYLNNHKRFNNISDKYFYSIQNNK